jgi:hypothetical protein
VYASESDPCMSSATARRDILTFPTSSFLNPTPHVMAGTRRSGRTGAVAAPKYTEVGSASEDSDAPKLNAKKTPRKRARKEVEAEDEDEDDVDDDA